MMFGGGDGYKNKVRGVLSFDRTNRLVRRQLKCLTKDCEWVAETPYAKFTKRSGAKEAVQHFFETGHKDFFIREEITYKGEIRKSHY